VGTANCGVPQKTSFMQVLWYLVGRGSRLRADDTS
jgi:hypothetical protein